jgi:hypothetical protein
MAWAMKQQQLVLRVQHMLGLTPKFDTSVSTGNLSCSKKGTDKM